MITRMEVTSMVGIMAIADIMAIMDTRISSRNSRTNRCICREVDRVRVRHLVVMGAAVASPNL